MIKVDGEENFRKIKELPTNLTSKEQRPQEQVSNSYFGQVEVQAYNGITRGEGLSIVAVVENGSVVRLDWNQRSYDPVTQPTAYQYYTPPVINFIPENGEGGGARAAVIVSKGQVISVELISGGSGYTKAPKVVVARRFKVFKDTDIGVSLINASINIEQSTGLNVISNISVLGNQIEGVNTFTSILFDSPVDSDRVITAEIQTGELNIVDGNSTMPVGTDQPDGAQIVYIEPDPVEIEGVGGALRIQDNETVVSVKINSVLTTNSISTVSRQITSAINPDVIQNTALSNINYFQVGAFLDAPLDASDTIIYVGNTDKFSTNGYLLIGTEIVRYLRKINDRFLNVERGQNNTTAQNWGAGTFLRQIPDPVSIAYAGVAVVESESQLVTVKGGAAVGVTQRLSLIHI